MADAQTCYKVSAVICCHRESAGRSRPRDCSHRNTVFSGAWRRKVRAPQGRVPDNVWTARVDGQCHRKYTACSAGEYLLNGKGEMVR